MVVIRKKRKVSKETRKSMFDEELDKYETYEQYLDSLVSEEDHKYLQDEEMARAIAELGYRSSGDTLTRENFYKLKNKLAEARLLTMQRRPSDPNGLADSRGSSVSSEGDSNAEPENQANTLSRPISTASNNKSRHGIVRALRSRVQALRSGELLSILFIRTKMPRKPRSIYLGTIGAPARAKMWDSIKSSVDGEPGDMEISGHIDLDMRMKTENILPYINGEKRMLPKKTDLTFYNWDRGTAAYNSTDNFQVVAELPRLLLRHIGSDATLDITTSTPGILNVPTSSIQFSICFLSIDAKRSMESKTTRGSGWQHIKTSDDETYAMIFDVYILYEGSNNSRNSD